MSTYAELIQEAGRNEARLRREAEARRRAEAAERAARAAALRRAEGRRDRDAEWTERAREIALPAWHVSPRSFRRWLSAQRSRLDSVGAFARAVEWDSAFPVDVDRVIPHLVSCFAEPEVLAAAREALVEWRRGLNSEIDRQIGDADGRGCPERADSIRAQSVDRLQLLDELLAEDLGGEG